MSTTRTTRIVVRLAAALVLSFFVWMGQQTKTHRHPPTYILRHLEDTQIGQVFDQAKVAYGNLDTGGMIVLRFRDELDYAVLQREISEAGWVPLESEATQEWLKRGGYQLDQKRFIWVVPRKTGIVLAFSREPPSEMTERDLIRLNFDLYGSENRFPEGERSD